MKQLNRYRPSKDKEQELREWMKNRIVLLNRKKNDRRKMDRWMRKLLKTDMMKDIVRAYDKNRIMLDDYKFERPSYEYRVAMGGGA